MIRGAVHQQYERPARGERGKQPGLLGFVELTEVVRRRVPYPLGFWIRGDGLVNRATLPSVSGGGLTTGSTKDYRIELKPGEYVYSCPLNPTPDYKLVVKDS